MACVSTTRELRSHGGSAARFRPMTIAAAAGGEAIAQVLDGLERPIVLKEPLLGAEGEHGVDERHVDARFLVGRHLVELNGIEPSAS